VQLFKNSPETYGSGRFITVLWPNIRSEAFFLHK
jgi:hypothetical protein